MSSPFDVLGVDADADEGAIQTAYRRRIKQAHPDQGGSVEEFQRVQAAYDAVTAATVTPDRANESPRAEPADSDPRGVTVEVLDYEVLADNGWGLGEDERFQGTDVTEFAAHTGTFEVSRDQPLLEGAEDAGHTWPYSCRGGACANCAVGVCEGEVSMPVDHILPRELLERGFRLSCVGEPTTDDLAVVFNVKHMPALEELLLPPGPFARRQNE